MHRLLLAMLASSSLAYADSVADQPAVPGDRPVSLTSDQRRTRAELIRDSAAGVGMTNAALLAGIGEVETNFAHCWSEATWACQGPPSSTCGGGPVIAGSADGPCSLEQGGLGMFQFDSGTFSQTVATYGPDIVTMQGNVSAVVPFLVTRAIQSVAGVNTEEEALAWMNSITIQDGDPQYEDWLYFVAWRYNGCQGCTTQINKYRNGTNKLRDEFGPDFWTIVAEPVVCDPLPGDGRVIEETDPCFHKSGTASSWYHSDRGMEGACLLTYTTDDPEPDNQATWELAFEATGRYAIEVYTDGAGGLSQTHQANYVVTHAGGTTEVVIDQAAVADFVWLGEFDFAAGVSFGVALGDNTGEAYDPDAKIGITFDAVRVIRIADLPDGDPGNPDDDDEGSGCSTGGSSGLAIALLALGLRSRRRLSV